MKTVGQDLQQADTPLGFRHRKICSVDECNGTAIFAMAKMSPFPRLFRGEHDNRQRIAARDPAGDLAASAECGDIQTFLDINGRIVVSEDPDPGCRYRMGRPIRLVGADHNGVSK